MKLFEQYLVHWRYLGYLILRYKFYMGIVLLAFFNGALFAFSSAPQFKVEFGSALSNQIGNILVSPNGIFFGILTNNLRVILINLLLGFTVIIPIFFIFLNGLFIWMATEMGLMTSSLFISSQRAALYAIAALLPHGIIELPAFFAAQFMSFILGVKLVSNRLIEPDLSKKKFILKTLSVFIFVLVPLICVAALVESYITPKLTVLTLPQFQTNFSRENKDNAYILDASEIPALGLEKVAVNDKSIRNPISAKFQLIYLYEDQLSDKYKSVYKKLVDSAIESNVYSIGTDSNLYVYAYKLEPDFYNEVLTFYSEVDRVLNYQYPTETFERLKDNVYRFKSKGKTAYLGYLRHNDILVAVYYDRTEAVFNQVLQAQEQKLAK